MGKSVADSGDGGVFSSADRFDEEWWWVFGYGLAAVTVVAVNLLCACSVLTNSFLRRANVHRMFLLLSLRNVARAAFSLAVLYTARYMHPKDDWVRAEVNSTKAGSPLLCDVLCALDTFLLTVPMYFLVATAVHMFIRYPSPQIGKLRTRHGGSYSLTASSARSSRTNLDSASAVGDSKSGVAEDFFSSKEELRPALPPRESCLASLLLPAAPAALSALLSSPVPLLHLTSSLQPVPGKTICSDTSQHLTFDVCAFILGYCSPAVLLFCLAVGLTIRRCIHCSSSHCCNSWCREESVLVQLSAVVSAASLFPYFPILQGLADRLGISTAVLDLLTDKYLIGRPEISRAAEMAVSGAALPLLLYFWLPAYRKFRSEPDGADVKMLMRSSRFRAM